jgi:hypothetical protein
VQIPSSWNEADSILQSKGYKVHSQGHLTYVAGMIAYVQLYKAEDGDVLMVNGTPDSKAVYSISGTFFDGTFTYFNYVKDSLTETYGKPYKVDIMEHGTFSKYEAEWLLDYRKIELGLFSIMKSYEGVEICKFEQPTGKPMDENGKILHCY